MRLASGLSTSTLAPPNKGVAYWWGGRHHPAKTIIRQSMADRLLAGLACLGGLHEPARRSERCCACLDSSLDRTGQFPASNRRAHPAPARRLVLVYDRNEKSADSPCQFACRRAAPCPTARLEDQTLTEIPNSFAAPPQRFQPRLAIETTLSKPRVPCWPSRL
jgi:hypothetical protein